MLIKKDKKLLFSISVFSSFFNKKFVSIALKFLGIIQIFLFLIFIYIAIVFDKDEIKGLLLTAAQKTYWVGKALTNLPIKWSNNVLSNHSILNIVIAPKDYQLLMTLRDDAIKNRLTQEKHKRSVPAIINYINEYIIYIIDFRNIQYYE